MTPEQKDIVRHTWSSVAPIADAAADLFYDRLFELDPQLKQLFEGTDLNAQKEKLVQALATTVANLDAIGELAAALADLGRRHATYGVVDAHYDTVGQALLWTLEKGLGDAWEPAAEQAWATAYRLVSETMKQGAAEAGQQAA